MSWNQKENSECRGVGTQRAETGLSVLETVELRFLSNYCVADRSQALYTHYLVSFLQQPSKSSGS